VVQVRPFQPKRCHPSEEARHSGSNADTLWATLPIVRVAPVSTASFVVLGVPVVTVPINFEPLRSIPDKHCGDARASRILEPTSRHFCADAPLTQPANFNIAQSNHAPTPDRTPTHDCLSRSVVECIRGSPRGRREWLTVSSHACRPFSVCRRLSIHSRETSRGRIRIDGAEAMVGVDDPR